MNLKLKMQTKINTRFRYQLGNGKLKPGMFTGLHSHSHHTHTPDVVEVGLEVDIGAIVAVLLQGVHAGLPLLHRSPVAQGHVALARLVSQEVHHLRGTLARLQQHSLPAIS